MHWNIAIATTRWPKVRPDLPSPNWRAERASGLKIRRGEAALLIHLPEGASAIALGDEQIISRPKAGERRCSVELST